LHSVQIAQRIRPAFVQGDERKVCASAQIGTGKKCVNLCKLSIDFWMARVYNKPRHRFLGARRLYHTAADLSTPNLKKIAQKKSPSVATREGKFPILAKLRTFFQKLQKGHLKGEALAFFHFFTRWHGAFVGRPR
jgi:hypothetical protein